MTEHLRSHRIVETLELLQARISERFPGSGLSKLCGDLVETSRLTADRVRAVHRPNILLRVVTVIVIAGFAYGLYAISQHLNLGAWLSPRLNADGTQITEGLESLVNLFIMVAVALWFLLTAEQRIRRHSILKHLHELRSIAHVVDMHQLTKDPAAILNKTERTASSPKRDMSEYQLARYLDYCTEMLSLTGKLAALYGERSGDTEIIAAANDIETLTTNLGRKIWQKITMIGGTRT